MEGSSVEDSPREGTPTDLSPLRKWTEEKQHYEEIMEYIKQVDEILDFIKPFPRDYHCPEPESPLNRSAIGDSSDHLENLIKLVEQLKDLKEKDTKTNERTQYLKDLKKLRERKKLLKYEAEVGGHWGKGKQEEKVRSSTPFRKQSRGRSKSVNIDDIVKERFRRGRYQSEEEQTRKLSTGSQKQEKSKVSKWTKVKEAFRWEKASGVGKGVRRDDGQYLQVPQDKTPESLSDSPLSGQISGSSSVGAPSTLCLAVSSGYSGEHSSEGHSTSSGCGVDLPPPPPPPPPLPSGDDLFSLPLIQDLSSSSSSEKLDELLTYSELLAKGNDRSDIIADSFDVAFHDKHSPEDPETRRSKSLDGEMVLGPSSSLVQHLSKQESLTYSKKAHKTAWSKVKDIIQTRKDSLKKKSKKREFEKGDEVFSSQSGLDLEVQEEPSSPEDKPKEMSIDLKPRIELTETPEATPLPPPMMGDSLENRRLTPVLTITLPSTEELRSISSGEVDPPTVQKSNLPEEKSRAVGQSEDFFENIPKYEKNKTGSYHRFSKWSKVKRAFLTNPSRSAEYVTEVSSVPSSPNKQISFFSDVESDELSSGEWTDNKPKVQDKTNAESESPGTPFHDDIQKQYLELSQKLTHEFDQKMREWERIKSETKTKQEGSFQRQKSEDWDKIPRSATQRESMTIPLPKLDDLSPEFKKKLDEWKKIKKSQTISAVPSTSSKDEVQGQNFKMRIGEWQRWRPRGSHKMTKAEQSEEFAKKLEEWQRIKGTIRRSRSQSDRDKEDGGNRTPSPCLRRKTSKKKTTSSGKSSGTESLSGSLKEKDGRSGGSRKPQKEKDLHWLEKELHKIERGKMRLEREKEKFLQREARLEKMKRTMGTTSPTQEILIKTPTGFFRFEGISQKFTKKLYEWEKARGIAPEASTFALLEECANRKESGSNGISLQRSKSMGSVIEASSTIEDLQHHPSSLSLNDVDELDGLDESRGSSEIGQDEDEPEAIIVDVEDVVEETAALMADTPAIQGEVPVYSYAPSEVTRLIDSSGSETEVVKEAGKEEPELEVTGATFRRLSENVDADDANGKEPPFSEGMSPLEAVNRVDELSTQLLSLAEKLEIAFGDDKKTGRNSLYTRRKHMSSMKTLEVRLTKEVNDHCPQEEASLQDLSQLPTLITNKVLELKSGLNALKTAAESPGQESRIFEFPSRCTQDSSKQSAMESPSKPEESGELVALEKSKPQVLFGELAAETYDKRRSEAKPSPEVIKRKIKEKISMMQRMTTEAQPRTFKNFDFRPPDTKQDLDEKTVIVRENDVIAKQKKVLKTRRVTDTNIAYKEVVEKSAARSVDVFVETKNKSNSQTPVNVFVPTTRKIISPVRRDSKGTTSILSYVIDDIAPEKKTKKELGQEEKPQEPEVQPSKTNNRDIGIPPLPNSPLSPRKPTSPSIRMMIAKYNQKVEQAVGSDTGTFSPKWRSPIFERRFPESVQKSASVGLMRSEDQNKVSQESLKGILKSSSAGVLKAPDNTELTASSLRALRIKKAKEEFLSRGPDWSATSTPIAESPSNRLSHVSIGSESSFEEGFDSNLIKSASAGTINMEDGSRRSSDLERGDESTKTKSSSKFGIFSIKSRFRKVRMRRSKEKNIQREGAVTALCRQSLFLEIPVGQVPTPCSSKSCPSSPVLERSKPKSDTWIRDSARKMFKGKDPKPDMS